MINDYRITKYCNPFKDIIKNKKELDSRMKRCRPRLKNIYNGIKSRQSECRKPFSSLYNYKCAYCGNSKKNIPLNLFEIDHYINEASFTSKDEAGTMSNLVFSCYDCNRGKSGLFITKEYRELLNPDTNEIANVFYRDNDYYIKILNKYEQDKFILEFYKKLGLGAQVRRLDFLLLNISGLCETSEDSYIKGKLYEILNKLKEKRNSFL